MSFPAQYNDAGQTEFDRLEAEVRGRSLVLNCQLPGGKKELLNVTSGQDVAFAKSLLARKLDVPYSAIQLFLDNTLMIDPLSFNDFPAIKSLPAESNILIKVVLKQ